MNIRWEVADGYVNSAKFDIDIDDNEIAEYETLEDKIEFIENFIQEDFEQRVSWSANVRKALLTNRHEQR